MKYSREGRIDRQLRVTQLLSTSSREKITIEGVKFSKNFSKHHERKNMFGNAMKMEKVNRNMKCSKEYLLASLRACL